MQKIGEEGGYDKDELQALKDSANESDGSVANEFVEVDPVYIQVSNEVAVEQKEYEARAVIIEYDARGKAVSVELLWDGIIEWIAGIVG